jgi:hypothetical protein
LAAATGTTGATGLRSAVRSSRVRASACTVGDSNSATLGSTVPTRFLTRASICSPSSELPLRSKKLSRVPTGSTPSTSVHSPASSRSVAVIGGT